MTGKTPKGWKTRTRLVHEGVRRSQYGEVSEPIILTQGFVYETAEQAEARFDKAGPDEFIYARYGNPTVRMFEERIAGLEGAEDGFATASGMAAVHAALASMLQAGDHVVSARALFGSCLYILEDVLTRFGVEVSFVDGTDLDQWRAAVRPDTKAIFLESMSNPTLEVIDLPAVAEIAHAVGATVIVDNVFSTPVFSRAIELGADVVVYSATKHIDGQGRVLGGVVLGTEEFIRKTVEPFAKHTGCAMSPFTAWVLLKGLGDARSAGARAGGDGVGGGAGAGGRSSAFAGDFPGVGEPSRPCGCRQTVGAGRHGGHAGTGGRTRGSLPVPERASDRGDFQQSGRCEVDRHASRDDDALAAD